MELVKIGLGSLATFAALLTLLCFFYVPISSSFLFAEGYHHRSNSLVASVIAFFSLISCILLFIDFITAFLLCSNTAKGTPYFSLAKVISNATTCLLIFMNFICSIVADAGTGVDGHAIVFWLVFFVVHALWAVLDVLIYLLQVISPRLEEKKAAAKPAEPKKEERLPTILAKRNTVNMKKERKPIPIPIPMPPPVQNSLLISKIIVYALYFGVMTFLLIFILAAETIPRASDVTKYPMPGKLYTLPSGVKLHLDCKGATSDVTMVFENAYGAVSSLSWFLITPELRKHLRVCEYDRAGYGYSEIGSFPRSAKVIAQELHDLLQVAGELKNKLILVGHSNGGKYIRAYQKMFPNEVVGMGFLDSNNEFTMFQEAQTQGISVADAIRKHKAGADYLRGAIVFDIFGATRFGSPTAMYYSSWAQKLNGTCTGLCPKYDARVGLYNNRFIVSFWNEQYSIPDACDELMQLETQAMNAFYSTHNSSTPYYSLGNMPIAVVSAGSNINGTCERARQATYLKDLGFIRDVSTFCADYDSYIQSWGPIWLELQRNNTKLSSDSTWTILPDSQHFVQWDYPDEVIQILLDLVNRVNQQNL